MITKTSLKHVTTLTKIKAAVLKAVRMAHSEPSGVYMVPVFNARGGIMMAVLGVKNGGFRVQTGDYEEITDMVKKALKEFHEVK